MLAPIRLTVFFIITFYSFAFSRTSPLAGGSTYIQSSWGEELKNRVLFTWAFVEMITWFWVFVTLREERRDAAIRLLEKQKAEESL